MVKILGILNITQDSFSDGGKFLDPVSALAHADGLLADGADIIDIGAASSHPDAAPVSPELEIARLEKLVGPLHDFGASLSIDSFSLPVQRWALKQGVDYLNDIHGFAEPALYPELAASSAKLIVMHMVQEKGIATGKAIRADIPAEQIFDRIVSFFDKRLTALTGAGIAPERMILDPGMGFFLSTDPEASLIVLGRLPELAEVFGLPLLVSVSRKSFITALAPGSVQERGAAFEMFAVAKGAAYIRTHEPARLREGLKVMESLSETGF